jgi:hypothetical protein
MFTMTRFVPPTLLIFVCLLTSAAVAGAQSTEYSRPSPQTKIDGQELEKRSAAYSNGYRDGWIEGESAWAQSSSFNLHRSGNYGKADRGYSEDLGAKNDYKRLYRKGFQDGYSVGYGIPEGASK